MNVSQISTGECELTGAANLMACYGLDHSYSKFSGKKVKEQLSAFLPSLPGVIDGPGQADNSSLRSVIEKQPILGKELMPLTSVQLSGFRLHPGPLPEQYRYLNTAPTRKHKNKHKKHKHRDGILPQETSPAGGECCLCFVDCMLSYVLIVFLHLALNCTDPNLDTHEKKHKKQKRHEDDKERKKRKKEKKRKKQRHSPDHPGMSLPQQSPVF